MNRAVQGDVVVVEVFDEKEWKAPGDEVVDQEGGSPLVVENVSNLTLQQLRSKTTMLMHRRTRAQMTKSPRASRRPFGQRMRRNVQLSDSRQGESSVSSSGIGGRELLCPLAPSTT